MIYCCIESRIPMVDDGVAIAVWRQIVIAGVIAIPSIPYSTHIDRDVHKYSSRPQIPAEGAVNVGRAYSTIILIWGIVYHSRVIKPTVVREIAEAISAKVVVDVSVIYSSCRAQDYSIVELSSLYRSGKDILGMPIISNGYIT
jgi:hypothetical protein